MKPSSEVKRPAALELRVFFSAAVTLFCLAPLLSASQAPSAAPKVDQQARGQAQEQKGSLEGTVVDAPSGKPVKDVTLLLAPTSDVW